MLTVTATELFWCRTNMLYYYNYDKITPTGFCGIDDGDKPGKYTTDTFTLVPKTFHWEERNCDKKRSSPCSAKDTAGTSTSTKH